MAEVGQWLGSQSQVPQKLASGYKWVSLQHGGKPVEGVRPRSVTWEWEGRMGLCRRQKTDA